MIFVLIQFHKIYIHHVSAPKKLADYCRQFFGIDFRQVCHWHILDVTLL